MKKYFLLFAISFIACTAIFAGPFSLKMGMTLKEVTAACNGERPEQLENDDRYYIKPAKSHSRFKTYIAWISEEYGLYAIRGISDDIPTDGYGKELKNAFYNFYDRVSAIYGNGEVVDEIAEKPRYDFQKNDSYWSETLKDGSRKLYAEWASWQEYTKMKDDLVYIKLWTLADGYVSEFKGKLLIDYQFSNITQVENKEDDVL